MHLLHKCQIAPKARLGHAYTPHFTIHLAIPYKSFYAIVVQKDVCKVGEKLSILIEQYIPRSWYRLVDGGLKRVHLTKVRQL